MLARLARLVLPALAPSWRFFDRIGPAPVARIATAAEPSNWRPLAPRRSSRRPTEVICSLFHNPQRNEALYIQSLAERLITEDCAHAAKELRRFAQAAAHEEQFFLSVIVTGPGNKASEEVYRSGPHAASTQ